MGMCDHYTRVRMGLAAERAGGGGGAGAGSGVDASQHARATSLDGGRLAVGILFGAPAAAGKPAEVFTSIDALVAPAPGSGGGGSGQPLAAAVISDVYLREKVKLSACTRIRSSMRRQHASCRHRLTPTLAQCRRSLSASHLLSPPPPSPSPCCCSPGGVPVVRPAGVVRRGRRQQQRRHR
jgi:hypothetical protein